MFELCMPLFLVSFGSVDYLKGKPLGTIFTAFNGKFTGTNCAAMGLAV